MTTEPRDRRPAPAALTGQPSAGDHIAFYRFTRLPEVEAARDALVQLASGLSGSVIVATEGVNGMLAGTREQIDAFLAAAAEDPVVGPVFDGITVKRTGFTRPPFRRLLIRVKEEIVPLGIEGVDVSARAADVAATNVSPAQWRDLLDRDDVVVLDNRNSFEHRVGRFRGAVDPGVRNFRDFTGYVEQHAEQWRRDGTTVAMYCTGGIRCEKASPWMQDLGLTVVQLSGGILNYLAETPDAEHDFDGECFVFDERVTLDASLEETGRRRSEIDET